MNNLVRPWLTPDERTKQLYDDALNQEIFKIYGIPKTGETFKRLSDMYFKTGNINPLEILL